MVVLAYTALITGTKCGADFFGLRNPTIGNLIEHLKNSERCVNYPFFYRSRTEIKRSACSSKTMISAFLCYLEAELFLQDPTLRYVKTQTTRRDCPSFAKCLWCSAINTPKLA